MKKEKKRKILIVLLVFSGLNFHFILTPLVKGYSHSLHYFDTDASTYFIDGDIEINATYDMWYEPLNEEMYFQVHIYNSTNDLIWNTSKYDVSGNYEEIWLVNISDLNLPNEPSNTLSVRFFVHWYYIPTTETSDTFLREKQIQVIKKEISCQLIGFGDHLKIGNNLSFKARFYDDLLGNSKYLKNQTVLFKIENNGEKIFDCNYTINSSGLIDINICSSTHLKIGQNSLFFEIENNNYYNDSVFGYDVFIEELLAPIENPWQLSVFSFASILVIASIIIMTISNINKNVRHKSLSEITFRY